MQENKDNLLYFMVSLRLTPLIPNPVVTYASPLVGMPFKTFVLGSFIGLLPAQALHVSTGQLLEKFGKAEEPSTIPWQNFLIPFVLSILALAPTYFSEKKEEGSAKSD